jgi:hypothetical protein
MDAFFQSSFEQTHHLGEIIGAYWQVGKTSAPDDVDPDVDGKKSLSEVERTHKGSFIQPSTLINHFSLSQACSNFLIA